MVVDYLDPRVRVEVEVRPRRVRRLPALHFIKGALEAVGGTLLAVLKADALAYVDLERRLADLTGVLHHRPNEMAPLVGTDWLLHSIPGDE